MSKLEWKPGTMIYPLPAVMVTCGDMEKSNIITIGWTGIVNTNPAMTYISVRKERFSHNIIKENMEFVINLTTKDLVRQTDYCGVKSGKNIDKFKETGLTKEKANHVKCPLIKESPVNIECKVVEIKELGSHDMFLAKILSVNVDDKYLDENETFDMQKCGLMAYSHGKYYELGKQIGKFGYSVEKKKKKKKNNK